MRRLLDDLDHNRIGHPVRATRTIMNRIRDWESGNLPVGARIQPLPEAPQ